MIKYLLSTGNSTSKIEYYVLDLFKLYLNIYPRDVPGASDLGFDFILGDVKKDELISEIKNRVNKLIVKISNKFSSSSVSIKLDSIEIIDETRVKITIIINDYTGEVEKLID